MRSARGNFPVSFFAGNELFSCSAKQFVSIETAVQLAVHQPQPLRWFQTNALERVLIGGENPCRCSRELELEAFAYILVEPQHVLVAGQAFAIRRIDDHQRAVRMDVLQLLHTYLTDINEPLHTRLTDVLNGLLHSIETCIAAVDAVGELALAGVVVVYLLKEVAVKIVPLLKGESLAEDARTDVLRNQSRLDKQCPRAAHKVVEVRLSFPSCEQEHSRRKSFIQRCFGLRDAVAAFVERLAGGVEEQRDLVVADVEVELIVGILGVDGGTLPEVAAEAVDDGVLGLEGGVVGMGENLARGGGVDHESAVDVEYLLPPDAVDLVVELLVVVGLEGGEGLEDGQGRAAAVVGTIEETHVAHEGDGAGEDLDLLGAHGAELVGEDFFEAHHGLGHHGEGVG